MGLFGKGNSPAKLASSLHDERLKSDIILNAIDSGVIVIDSNNTIQLLNPAASRLTGWPKEEAIGLDFSVVIHLVNDKGVDYSEVQNPFKIAMTGGQNTQDNTAILSPRAGDGIPINISVTPLFDAQKRLTGVVGVFSDVTQQRKEERQRAEFISTASHEMRTPVAAIEGYLALAMNEKVSKIDSKARDYLEKAHTSTQHLGKLFQDLLTSARAEDGRLSNHPSVVDMAVFLQQLTTDLSFGAEKKGLIVEYILGTADQGIGSGYGGSRLIQPMYYVHADPERMREVITNLFDNAVKYTETGQLTIGLTGNDQVVQFYIKDTGPGIPANDIPHLFQKFYRVDSSATRVIGGTGLGLFICRKIVELYGGRIWLESVVGSGTTFYINLPRLSVEKAKAMQSQESNVIYPELPTQTTL